MRNLRRVGQDKSAAGCVVERPTQNHVDLHHRLVVQAATAVGSASVEEIGIEAFEVVGSEVAERDLADPRDNVQVDGAPVPVPCAYP